MKKIGFDYSIEWTDRKTFAISVLPDCSVVIKAPHGTEACEIENRLAKRSGWIVRQIRYFDSFNPRATPRHFVAGEGQLFLGKMYRLTLSKGPQSVHMQGDRLLVSTDDLAPLALKDMLERWYRSQAHRLFPIIEKHEWLRMGHHPGEEPELVIKKLERRWGSLSAGRILTLNVAIIKAPETCIEYVICHELCHAEFPNHGPEFYTKLSRLMPDWEARKQTLEMLLK